MKKTRKSFRKIWDARLARLVNATFEKFEEELDEHGVLMAWAVKHILLPVSVFYAIAGLFFRNNIFDSLFLGLMVFIYSNFVPDLDSLMVVAKGKHKKFWSLEKFGLLFLGPLFVYYAISGEAKPIYAKKPKEFHTVRYLLLYCAFLLAVGLVFYSNLLEQLSLPFFGFLGYAIHLAVDNRSKFRKTAPKIRTRP